MFALPAVSLVLIFFVGAVLRKLGIASRNDGLVLLRLAVAVTLPASILQTLPASFDILGESAFLPCAFFLLYVVVAWGLSRTLGSHRRAADRTLVLASALSLDLPCLGAPALEALYGSFGLYAAGSVEALSCFASALLAPAMLAGDFASEEGAGVGSSTHLDGGMYDGEWLGKKKDGLGVYAYPSGAAYQGEWRDNLKHGRGIYLFPSGGYYAGEWRAGRRSGLGVRALKGGDVVAGTWADDKLVEECAIRDCDSATAGAAAAAEAALSVAAKARRSASRRGALWRFATPAAAAVAASCALVGAGEVLPDAAAALVAAVAAAHRPLLLLGAGVAALPPKEAAPGQLRPVVDLLAAKFVAGLLIATVVGLTVPAGAVRSALASAFLAPVAPLIVAFAAAGGADPIGLAGLGVAASAAASSALFAAVFLASAAPNPLVLPAASLALAGAVYLVAAAVARSLAPQRMRFAGGSAEGAQGPGPVTAALRTATGKRAVPARSGRARREREALLWRLGGGARGALPRWAGLRAALSRGDRGAAWATGASGNSRQWWRGAAASTSTAGVGRRRRDTTGAAAAASVAAPRAGGRAATATMVGSGGAAAAVA